MQILFQQNQYPDLYQYIIELDVLLNSSCPKYSAEGSKIYISTWEIEKQRFQHPTLEIDYLYYNNSLIPKSLAINKCKYYYLNRTPIRIIIINTYNCINLCQLNEGEFKNVLLHELGHLLNFPDFNFQDEELFNKCIEIYADNYSKKFGYKEFLQSTIDKYISRVSADFKYIEERINHNNKNEIVEGIIKPY